MKDFRWRVYFLLLSLSFLGAAGIVPYMSSLSTDLIQMPPVLMGLVVFLQSFLISAVLGFAGLKLSMRTGLGVPVLENLLYESGSLKIKKYVTIPLLLGFACGLALFLLDLLMINILDIEAVGEAAAPVWWKGLLASFYGGVSEEIMLRLFAMNLIIFILNKIDKDQIRKTSTGKVLFAMILSSLIFGAAHLPAALSVMSLTPGVVARTLILNFIPGMLFGRIYWKRSFLSAMVSHFAADITIHVVLRYIIDTAA